jgi:hypothetical protein
LVLEINNDATFAALIAPIIDRVAISVHNAIDKQAVAELRGSHRFHPAALALFAPTIAAGTISGHEYRELTRYEHFGSSADFLQGLADRGAVTLADNGDIIATEAGREVALELVNLQTKSVDELFAPLLTHHAHLRSSLDRAAEAAVADSTSVLAPYAKRGWLPTEASNAVHIWNNAVILRLHRSDAHAQAWASARLTPTSMRALQPGTQRNAIESDTNVKAGVAWNPLTTDERLQLLAGLGALPGTGSPI